MNSTWTQGQAVAVSEPTPPYRQKAKLTPKSTSTDNADRPPGNWQDSSNRSDPSTWSWKAQPSEGYRQQPSCSASAAASDEPAYVRPYRTVNQQAVDNWSWTGYDRCKWCQEERPRHMGQDCLEAPWNKKRREAAAASAAASNTDYSSSTPGKSWELLKKENEARAAWPWMFGEDAAKAENDTKEKVTKAWNDATREVLNADVTPKATLTPKKEEKQEDDPWASAPSDAKCQTEEDPLENVLRGARSHLDDETMEKMRAIVEEAQEKKKRKTPTQYVQPQSKCAPPPTAPRRAPVAPVKIPTPPKPLPPARPASLGKAAPRPPAHAPPAPEPVVDVPAEVPLHVPPPPVSYSVQPPIPQAVLPPPGLRPAMPYQEHARPAYVSQHYDAFAPGYNPYAQMSPRPSTVPMTITVDVPTEHIPQYFQGMPYPVASPPRAYGPYYNYR